MKVELLVDCAGGEEMPSQEALQQQLAAWLQPAAELADAATRETIVVVRLVDETESRELNLRYRQKDRPTNVLSFPIDSKTLQLPEEARAPLGDLAICWPLVGKEANQYGIPALNRLAHLAIHGYLHLLGYDHQEVAEQTEMEAIETLALSRAGIPDPYQLRDSA